MIFWVEASQDIGMGHLMESLVLAGCLAGRGVPVIFIVNPYSPAREEIQVRGFPCTEIDIDAIDDIVNFMRNKNENSILINHRNVSLNSMRILFREKTRVTLIDQLGNKPVICDVLINRSLTKEWLKYDYPEKQPLSCFGPEYAILDPYFIDMHDREKRYSQGNEFRILVTMGGVDRTGSTLRVVEALKPVHNISKEIILGRGFTHTARLTQLLEDMNDGSFSCYQGVNDLGDRMSRADIVISAGGNTVYEMACTGAPGIILWEDEHEQLQGMDFSKKGSVICPGSGVTTSVEDITNSVRTLLNDVYMRRDMGRCGKELVDGRGTDRICNVMMESYSNESIIYASGN